MSQIKFSNGKLFKRSWDTGFNWVLLARIPQEITNKLDAYSWYSEKCQG